MEGRLFQNAETNGFFQERLKSSERSGIENDGEKEARFRVKRKKRVNQIYSTTLNDAPGMPQIGQRSEVLLISMFPQTGQR